MMDKYQLSERDICTKFITPAIVQAGWQQHQFREEVGLTAVSYTHLDVYKRQMRGEGTRAPAIPAAGASVG